MIGGLPSVMRSRKGNWAPPTPWGQLEGISLATVVAGSLLNAGSQNLHLKAPGENVCEPDDLLADIGLLSVKQVFSLLRLADEQGELRLQLVKVCNKAADCLAWCLAGFEVPLLDLNISHDGRPELFEDEVLKVILWGVVNALIVQALVPCILNVVEEISSRIYAL